MQIIVLQGGAHGQPLMDNHAAESSRLNLFAAVRELVLYDRRFDFGKQEMRLLLHFAGGANEESVSQVARQLNLPRPNCSGTISSLVERRILLRDNRGIRLNPHLGEWKAVG